MPIMMCLYCQKFEIVTDEKDLKKVYKLIKKHEKKCKCKDL